MDHTTHIKTIINNFDHNQQLRCGELMGKTDKLKEQRKQHLKCIKGGA